MPDSGDALKASKFKSPSLKARALRLLSLREYSRKDLGSKLSEYARAKELWVRKFDMIATEPKEKARQYRFLVSKGFNADLVARIISGKPNKQ